MSRIGVALALFTVLPSMVFAHATPVEMVPDSGANVNQAKEISIRFSERLEQGSSRIKVTDSSGQTVTRGDAAVGSDSYTLTVPVEATDGVYMVSWSVVSKDDGHFTKGAYAFAVGSSTVASVAESSVVKLTSWKEVAAIFIEFLGNSILWGVFIVLAFVIRPTRERLSDSIHIIRRTFSALVVTGTLAAVCGAAWQIFIKGSELATLHSISLMDAVHMYLHTASGESTVYRGAALVVFGILFLIFRSRLYKSGLTWRDGLLVVCLLVFAYFRASISHATANPFVPELSLFINIVHLIDKDVWFGILVVLVVLVLVGLYDVLRTIIPRVFSILALNFALISLTASYIVWLHLRDFSNLTSTEWGEHFIKLAASAVVLVTLRAYHTTSLKWRPQLFARWASATLSAEMIAAGFVVFFSSLVIITSPPAHSPQARAFTDSDQGLSIRLEASPTDDTRALLTIQGSHQKPTVRIGEGEGALLVAIEEKFMGGYVFPHALIQGKDTLIEIIAPSDAGYDARVVFDLAESDLEPPEGHGRRLDLFTALIVLSAIASCAFGLGLEFLGKRSAPPDLLYSRARIFSVTCGVLAVCIVLTLLIRFASALFANDFKATCLADGNMWHMMQPMKAGVATSKTPREGCMLSSGTYQIADKREYDYLRALGPADVSLETHPESLRAGVPTTLAIKLAEKDGSPAKLGIEHEKILHVIIIGADMQSFAHVHADDGRALSPQEINSSSFEIKHTFPKAGEYVVAVDYLHGLVHESRQFRVNVGADTVPRVGTYTSPARFGGYDVEFGYSAPLVGDVATLRYTIRKNGSPVTDLVPYLGAAMHVAIIKNDLSEFVHTHGEVHPPGYVPPTTLKNHQHSPPPARFGPTVEAHAVFPNPGLYTVFGEFKDSSGAIVNTKFTVRVE